MDQICDELEKQLEMFEKKKQGQLKKEQNKINKRNHKIQKEQILKFLEKSEEIIAKRCKKAINQQNRNQDVNSINNELKECGQKSSYSEHHVNLSVIDISNISFSQNQEKDSQKGDIQLDDEEQIDQFLSTNKHVKNLIKQEELNQLISPIQRKIESKELISNYESQDQNKPNLTNLEQNEAQCKKRTQKYCPFKQNHSKLHKAIKAESNLTKLNQNEPKNDLKRQNLQNKTQRRPQMKYKQNLVIQNQTQNNPKSMNSQRPKIQIEINSRTPQTFSSKVSPNQNYLLRNSIQNESRILKSYCSEQNLSQNLYQNNKNQIKSPNSVKTVTLLGKELFFNQKAADKKSLNSSSLEATQKNKQICNKIHNALSKITKKYLINFRELCRYFYEEGNQQKDLNCYLKYKNLSFGIINLVSQARCPGLMTSFAFNRSTCNMEEVLFDLEYASEILHVLKNINYAIYNKSIGDECIDQLHYYLAQYKIYNTEKDQSCEYIKKYLSNVVKYYEFLKQQGLLQNQLTALNYQHSQISQQKQPNVQNQQNQLKQSKLLNNTNSPILLSFIQQINSNSVETLKTPQPSTNHYRTLLSPLYFSQKSKRNKSLEFKGCEQISHFNFQEKLNKSTLIRSKITDVQRNLLQLKKNEYSNQAENQSLDQNKQNNQNDLYIQITQESENPQNNQDNQAPISKCFNSYLRDLIKQEIVNLRSNVLGSKQIEIYITDLAINKIVKKKMSIMTQFIEEHEMVFSVQHLKRFSKSLINDKKFRELCKIVSRLILHEVKTLERKDKYKEMLKNFHYFRTQFHLHDIDKNKKSIKLQNQELQRKEANLYY